MWINNADIIPSSGKLDVSWEVRGQQHNWIMIHKEHTLSPHSSFTPLLSVSSGFLQHSAPFLCPPDEDSGDTTSESVGKDSVHH